MVKSKAIQDYENAKKKLEEMRILRRQGKAGEELLGLRKLLIDIFEVHEPWSDIIHGDIIHEFGVAHQNLGDYPQALDSLWSAAKLRSRINPIDLFYTLHQIVMCKLARGDSVENLSEDIKLVRKVFQLAYDHATGMKDFQACGYLSHNYAFYFQLENKWDEALLHYDESASFFMQAGYRKGKALSCLRQAQCFMETFKCPQAFECLDEAEEIFKKLGDEKRLKEVEKTREEVKKAQLMMR